MRAGEILSLAVHAGVAPGVSVLDLCCGVAGPGRLITGTLGCSYLGVDSSRSAVEIARSRAGGLPCRFEVGEVPPVPPGPHDVVLLLETMLAFRDKDPLLEDVSAALSQNGRFAFTLEEGEPLTDAERASMPDADTVWPVPHADLVRSLHRAGMQVRWQEECTSSHLEMVDSLLAAFTAHRRDITRQVGDRALDELLAGHRLWSEWLRSGRIRKFAFVAEKVSVAAA